MSARGVPARVTLGRRQRRSTVKRIRSHPWCQSETFASSHTLFAYAPFAPGTTLSPSPNTEGG
jgi:hypothetical protein